MRDDDVPCCTVEFWTFLSICLVLVSFAGITSGLALGLLSFGQVDLEVLIKAGRPHENKYAAKILPLVKNEHLLLCTLLVAKSLAMEVGTLLGSWSGTFQYFYSYLMFFQALPIFMDSILPFCVAIFMSVILGLAFAEIIPQAVCARYSLQLGAKLAFLVHLLLLIFFPISYPISKVLDWLLGRTHSALYRRVELKTLVDLHAHEAGMGGELTHQETIIIGGALGLTEKMAKDAMTPISETFSLDINSKLDMVTMGLIMNKGHSRIPIYSGNPNNIVGLILVKNLIFFQPEKETPIKHMTIRKIPRVYEDWPLYEILNLFLEGHSHMAVVVKEAAHHKTSKSKLCMPDVLRIHKSFNPKLNLPENKEGSGSLWAKQEERAGYFMCTSPLCYYSTDHSESSSPKQRDVKGQTLAREDLELLPSFAGEEVIGIITMEDVMEELLQKKILDETDEYVDLYNKIRINLPSWRRSSSSPARAPISGIQSRTREQSPLSSHAMVSHTQISPAASPTDSPVCASMTSASQQIHRAPCDTNSSSSYAFAMSLLYIMNETFIQFYNPKEAMDGAMRASICSVKPPLPSKLFVTTSPNNALNISSPIRGHAPTPAMRVRVNAKGFMGPKPTSSQKVGGSRSGGVEEKEEEVVEERIPQVVFERMIVRIVGFVGVPMAAGVGLLHVLGVMKERQLWEVPLWVPFLTTLVCFGASALGITYGSLSSSWDPDRTGSVLGFEEARQNWAEMWRDEGEG
ncbi:hypothetical protein SAY87_011720 [Trapa incisa]|uniref:CNNM transmembrane domain-containing protein n=1 Tax=Trapa incisa TaxID=236973 RepID=A0AAN7GIX9_9MYRT|nr:hypothetical protein SAY87_011720 [Trapa incisa]